MRFPRLGVAFRIFAGLIVICGLAAVTSVVAVSLFTRFHDAFNQIATSKLPGLISASQLAQQSGTIAANAPALVAVQSQAVREAVMARISDQIMLLDDMLGRLRDQGTDIADIAELERRKHELVENLERLNNQVERQLTVNADTGTLVAGLVELSERVYDAQSALLSGIGPPPPVAGAEPEAGAGREVLGWYSAANQAIVIMLASTRADHEAKVERLRRQFREALDQAASHLTRLPPSAAGRLEPLHRELSAQGLGERNVFASRMSEMALQRAIKGAVTRNQTVSDRLVAAVSDYFFAIEQDVGRRSAEFERVIRGGEQAIVAMAALSILGAIAIFFYIHRNVVRRLRSLQAAMVAHEAGKSVAIPTHGRDEIGDMARAMQFFVTTIQAREHDLSESEGRLRAILEQSPVGVLIARADGTVAFANGRAAELAGVPLDAFVGNRHSLAPDAEPDRAAGLPSVFQGRITPQTEVMARNVEVAVDRPDGSRVWALQTLQRTEFEGGPAVLAWSYDITERKRVEEQLREAKEQAEVAARSKSEFLATMSHEIRTPMNGVLGMLELIALTPLDGEQQRLVTTVGESATSLLRIIDDILDLSKIEAGKLDLEDLQIDPKDLLEGVADLLAPQAGQKRLMLICDVDAAVPSALRGDPGRLRQILFNLAGNAIKFTESGRVVLRARLDPAGAGTGMGAGGNGGRVRLRLEVEDTGIGISDVGQARLFQPFSQADSSTTRRFGGTGLGLAICTRLVEMMGGRIGVSSTPGQGSVFWFTVDLPLCDGAPFSGAGERWPAPHDDIDLSGLSIVVAEGDPAQRAVLIRYLESREAAVLDATDADEAVELVTLAGADLLVLAAGLPGGTPAEVLARIAEGCRTGVEGCGRPPPCLLLVEDREQIVEQDGIEIDHLNRPIHRDMLFRKIAALAGRAQPAVPEPPAVLTVPSVERAAGDAVILVAEDHPTNQQVILRQLRQLGFAADITADGVEALSAWRAKPYRLLITDCHMPRMDGYELSRQIRAAEGARDGNAGDEDAVDGAPADMNPEERAEAGGEPAAPRLPIVAMTANALAGEMERCRDAGMDDYLSKPVSLKQLAAVLNRWLGPADDQTAASGKPGRGIDASGSAAVIISEDTAPDDASSPPRPSPAPAAPIPTAMMPTAMTELPVLDMDHMREILGQLDADALDMLDVFLDSVGPSVERAVAAWAARDRETVRMAAHAAAGAARTAGARRLAEACSALERAIVQSDDRAAMASLDAMTDALPSVVAAIRALRPEPEGVV